MNKLFIYIAVCRNFIDSSSDSYLILPFNGFKKKEIIRYCREHGLEVLKIITKFRSAELKKFTRRSCSLPDILSV